MGSANHGKATKNGIAGAFGKKIVIAMIAKIERIESPIRAAITYAKKFSSRVRRFEEFAILLGYLPKWVGKMEFRTHGGFDANRQSEIF